MNGAKINRAGELGPPGLNNKIESGLADSIESPGSRMADIGFNNKFIEIGTLIKIGVKIKAERLLNSSVSRFFRICCQFLVRQFDMVK